MRINDRSPRRHLSPDSEIPAVYYGEVFTRRWVVDLILDLCDYTPHKDLTQQTLVDPAVGSGAFLAVALDRLLQARAKHSPDQAWESLSGALLALDLQQDHVRSCRQMVEQRLRDEGCPDLAASTLANTWVRAADFLLTDLAHVEADVIVGNPPYIRIEDLPPTLLASYRSAWPTMGGRADIYVGFFERGLDLLKPDGRLGYICADRWMRNQYGRKLRAKIIDGGWTVDTCLVMHDVDAFADEVAAYPAVTVIRRGGSRPAVVAEATEAFNEQAAASFVCWANGPTDELQTPAFAAARLPHWHRTSDSWPDGSPETLSWLEDLSERFPLLEDGSGQTRVGIGVATGADAVYVTKDPDAVERKRMLPLAMAADVKSGTYDWTGHYLINPWDENGLVDISKWPRLQSYLQERSLSVRRRAIAAKNERTWFRTIDKVTPALTDRPKLLLEDMKARPNPVLEPGRRYPHHNLYFVVSAEWDLKVLGGLLLSDVVERQIAAYCVKMRGRTLRFQAQYLRRVRVPVPERVSADVKAALEAAFLTRDRDAATEAALVAYGLPGLPR